MNEIQFLDHNYTLIFLNSQFILESALHGRVLMVALV